jgi:hypothetical protein
MRSLAACDRQLRQQPLSDGRCASYPGPVHPRPTRARDHLYRLTWRDRRSTVAERRRNQLTRLYLSPKRHTAATFARITLGYTALRCVCCRISLSGIKATPPASHTLPRWCTAGRRPGPRHCARPFGPCSVAAVPAADIKQWLATRASWRDRPSSARFSLSC